MSAQVNPLAVMDRQLRDRAERANRYRKNAEKSARKNGEPQITADRMAAYTDLQLVELRQARAAVAELVEAAELVADTASKEWQEADGSRNGATGNDGQRLYFVSPELIENLRAALARCKGEQA